MQTLRGFVGMVHLPTLGDSPQIISPATLRLTVSFQAGAVVTNRNGVLHQLATIHTRAPTEMWLTKPKQAEHNTIRLDGTGESLSCFTACFFSASSLRLTLSSQQNSGQHADEARDKGSQPCWPNAQTVLLLALGQ